MSGNGNDAPGEQADQQDDPILNAVSAAVEAASVPSSEESSEVEDPETDEGMMSALSEGAPPEDGAGEAASAEDVVAPDQAAGASSRVRGALRCGTLSLPAGSLAPPAGHPYHLAHAGCTSLTFQSLTHRGPAQLQVFTPPFAPAQTFSAAEFEEYKQEGNRCFERKEVGPLATMCSR